MKRVTGIGGIFFKSSDPAKLKEWYARHLGITASPDGYVSFEWRNAEEPEKKGSTVWEAFPASTTYFDPTNASHMINYRVDDLHALLAALREEGVTVDEKVEDTEYGKFGWITDLDGNRVELWEPPAEQRG